MYITLKKLSPESRDRIYFEKINYEAFPPLEWMSFDEIFEFASKTNTDVLGIYDGRKPIGFIVLLKNDVCGYIYYFAVDTSSRSKGYGAAAMKKLMETYPDLQLILDFEVLDKDAENYEQRVSRKNFYLNNGFHETGHYTLLSEERFEVVCSDGELRTEGLKDLLRILHEHRPEFPDVLI